jgi:hypothetical protein
MHPESMQRQNTVDERIMLDEGRFSCGGRGDEMFLFEDGGRWGGDLRGEE